VKKPRRFVAVRVDEARALVDADWVVTAEDHDIVAERLDEAERLLLAVIRPIEHPGFKWDHVVEFLKRKDA
jgi:hypothetical protein